jgi:hypothetical protein
MIAKQTIRPKFRKVHKVIGVKFTFEKFVAFIMAEGAPHNPHWAPQSESCGMKDFISRYNFVGNFDERLRDHSKLLLGCLTSPNSTQNAWERFGAQGWPSEEDILQMMAGGNKRQQIKAPPATNTSFFEWNVSPLKTGLADSSTPEIDRLDPVLREQIAEYYISDFELIQKIKPLVFEPSLWDVGRGNGGRGGGVTMGGRQGRRKEGRKNGKGTSPLSVATFYTHRIFTGPCAHQLY